MHIIFFFKTYKPIYLSTPCTLHAWSLIHTHFSYSPPISSPQTHIPGTTHARHPSYPTHHHPFLSLYPTTHLTIHTPCLPYPSSYSFLFLSPLYLYPLNPSFILPSSILISIPISLTNSFTLHFLPIISLHYVPISRISFKPILPYLCMAMHGHTKHFYQAISSLLMPCIPGIHVAAKWTHAFNQD